MSCEPNCIGDAKDFVKGRFGHTHGVAALVCVRRSEPDNNRTRSRNSSPQDSVVTDTTEENNDVQIVRSCDIDDIHLSICAR